MSYSPFSFGLIASGVSQAGKILTANESGDFEFQDGHKAVFGNDADTSISFDNGNSKIKIVPENKAIEIGHASSTTTVLGNLIVSGTTTTVDVEVVNTANGVVFEGATANDFETTLLCVDPTADRAVNLADSAGTLVPFAAAPAAGVQITSTPAELNILDGVTADKDEINILDGVTADKDELNILDGVTADKDELNYLDITTLGTAEASKAVTVSAASKITLSAIEIEGSNFDIDGGTIDGTNIGASSAGTGAFTTLDCNDGAFAIANLDIDGGTDIGAAIVDADLIIIDDGGAGTNRKCAVSRLKTYIGTGSLSVETESDVSTGETVSADVTLINTGGSNYTVLLPENAAEGTVYRVKKTDAATNTLTIQKTGSDTIDGATSIVLYHQYESLTVVSDSANYHVI